MKKFFTALTALAVTASAFAQITGSLSPSGGKLYSGDFKHGGSINITYSAPVGHTQVTEDGYVAVPPVATIKVNNQTIVLDAYEVGNTGLYWAVEFQDAVNSVLPENNQFYTMNVSVAGSADGTTVETLTGTYDYCPVFPLTGVSPEVNTTLSDKNQTVVFSFNQNVTYSSVVIKSGDKTTTLSGGTSNSSNKVSVALKESYWAEATTVTNNITVELTNVTLANGVKISNVANEEASIIAGYNYKEVVALQFLGVDPSPAEATYQQVYDDYWYASFNFNNEITVPTDDTTVLAKVTFYNASGRELDEVELTSLDVFGGWNYWNGTYGVQVAVPEVTEDATRYTTVKISLYNLSYNGEPITDLPSVVYKSTLPNKVSEKQLGQANVNGIEVGISEVFDIYSINGTVVKKNATYSDVDALNNGLYVVNGKKIVIR